MIKYFSILKTFISILIALFITVSIILLVSKEPLESIYYLFLGPFLTMRRMGNILELMTPLIFTGLATTIMFRANQFNLISEGVFYFSGLVATIIALSCSSIHNSFLLTTISILGATLVGGCIGIIPGILKVKWNASEIVSSLMLNSIFLYLGLYLLFYYFLDNNSGYTASFLIPESAKLPVMIPRTRVHIGLIFAIVVCCLVDIFFNKHTIGYGIRITGENSNFAKYSGMNVPFYILIAQFIGGCLAGLGGAVEILGMHTRFSWQHLPGYGFDGIIVAILARNNPRYVIVASLFLAYIRIGADIMSQNTNIAIEVVALIQALIIVLVASQKFLQKWKMKLLIKENLKATEE